MPFSEFVSHRAATKLQRERQRIFCGNLERATIMNPCENQEMRTKITDDCFRVVNKSFLYNHTPGHHCQWVTFI